MTTGENQASDQSTGAAEMAIEWTQDSEISWTHHAADEQEGYYCIAAGETLDDVAADFLRDYQVPEDFEGEVRFSVNTSSGAGAMFSGVPGQKPHRLVVI